MTQINIRRDGAGNVTFDTVSIDTTENVFFTNLDPKEAHFPSIASNQVGAFPSANSSQCIVAPSPPDNQVSLTYTRYQVQYTCNLHKGEQGIINVFSPLASATTALADATKGQPISEQQVVSGGMSPYAISGQQYQVTDSNGNVSTKSGIVPGLQLNASTDSDGITVSGTPTASGTYIFTFVVNDAMGGNLQQVQYTMKVA